MATSGFEFAYMLDGSNATPVIRDFILGVAAVHKVGDLMLMASDGYLDQSAASETEVTAVCQEAFTVAQITAGTTKAKCAIITRNQVWRCSFNAGSPTGVVGFTKTQDLVDCNTLAYNDISGGPCILVDKSDTDDDGNYIGYVVFADTTFGNA